MWMILQCKHTHTYTLTLTFTNTHSHSQENNGNENGKEMLKQTYNFKTYKMFICKQIVIKNPPISRPHNCGSVGEQGMKRGKALGKYPYKLFVKDMRIFLLTYTHIHIYYVYE